MVHPLKEAIATARSSWQRELREAVREIGELERLLELPTGSLRDDASSTLEFPLLVPRGFVARMRKRDPLDPLLRQILPTRHEDAGIAGFGPDPIGEHALARHGSIVKYPGRALLITTGACPVHCRYCFRREFSYADQTAARDDWEPALRTIRATPGVREIILSGGDPLSLSNERLGRLIARLEALPGIECLRIHTRFPVVLPSRIDARLVDILAGTRLDTVVVVHANHPAEIDETVRTAATALKHCTDYLLNQAVLLRGINDDVETLIGLGERLRRCGIVPYYLHLLDRVSGSAHFEVADDEAAALVAAMRKQAPGYLVPTLVRDKAGELCKTPLP